MKYKINKGFVIQKLDNDLVIFDSDKSVFFTLNESGAYIFQNLKKGFKDEEVISKMVKRYKIKSQTAKKDYFDCLKTLKKHKIVSDNKKN